MRKLVLAAVMIGFGVASAPAGQIAPPPVPVSYFYHYRYYWPYYDGYRPPACPYRHHWACWIDPYGRQGCGCLPDFGLYPGLY
jgi:hypothetical protein